MAMAFAVALSMMCMLIHVLRADESSPEECAADQKATMMGQSVIQRRVQSMHVQTVVREEEDPEDYLSSAWHRTCFDPDSCGEDGAQHCRDFECERHCDSKCYTADDAKACCDSDPTCTAVFGNNDNQGHYWTFHAPCVESAHVHKYRIFWKPARNLQVVVPPGTYSLRSSTGRFLSAARSMVSDRRNTVSSYAMVTQWGDARKNGLEWTIEGGTQPGSYRLKMTNGYPHPAGDQPSGWYLTAARSMNSDKRSSESSFAMVHQRSNPDGVTNCDWTIEAGSKPGAFRLKMTSGYTHPEGNQPPGWYLTLGNNRRNDLSSLPFVEFAQDPNSGAYDWMLQATTCGPDQKVVNKMCTDCPDGTTSSGDHDALGLDTVCDATECGPDEMVVNHQCRGCPAGTTSTGNHDASGYDTECQACFQGGFSYQPLNMEGQERSEEDTASTCQMRCRAVTGCEHFSYWSNGGCHLQDAIATKQPDHSVAGPRSCVPEVTQPCQRKNVALASAGSTCVQHPKDPHWGEHTSDCAPLINGGDDWSRQSGRHIKVYPGSGSSAWAAITFQQPTVIDEIVFKQRDWVQYVLGDFQVEVQDTAGSWAIATTVGDKPEAVLTIALTPPRLAKAVRMISTHIGSMYLVVEIEVFEHCQVDYIERSLVADEGNHLSTSHTTLVSCKVSCSTNSRCKSFAWGVRDGVDYCHLKDKILTVNDPERSPNPWGDIYHSYYLPQVPTPVPAPTPTHQACAPYFVTSGSISGCARTPTTSSECFALATSLGAPTAWPQSEYDRPHGCWSGKVNNDLWFNDKPASTSPCSVYNRCVCCQTEALR